MKKAFKKVLCIESENRFFKAGTIYPLITKANNNGQHIISADDEGEVYSLLCHDYARIHDAKGATTIDTIETPEPPRVVFIEL